MKDEDINCDDNASTDDDTSLDGYTKVARGCPVNPKEKYVNLEEPAKKVVNWLNALYPDIYFPDLSKETDEDYVLWMCPGNIGSGCTFGITAKKVKDGYTITKVSGSLHIHFLCH